MTYITGQRLLSSVKWSHIQNRSPRTLLETVEVGSLLQTGGELAPLSGRLIDAHIIKTEYALCMCVCMCKEALAIGFIEKKKIAWKSSGILSLLT